MAVTTAQRDPDARPPVGELLRSWRQRRSLSQLELALERRCLARHVSFLETGRARPEPRDGPPPGRAARCPAARPQRAAARGRLRARRMPSAQLETPEMAPVRRRSTGSCGPRAVSRRGRRPPLQPVSANDALVAAHRGRRPRAARAARERAAHHAAPRGDGAEDQQPRGVERASAAPAGAPGRRSPAIAELERLHEELAAYPGCPSGAAAARSAAEIALPLRLRRNGEELSFLARSRRSAPRSTSRLPSSRSRRSIRRTS